VIRGTRRALPPAIPWPRPGVIVIDLLPAITPTADSAESAVQELKNRSRAMILARLEEPDLAP
jgi:hypothetical protein